MGFSELSPILTFIQKLRLNLKFFWISLSVRFCPFSEMTPYLINYLERILLIHRFTSQNSDLRQQFQCGGAPFGKTSDTFLTRVR